MRSKVNANSLKHQPRRIGLYVRVSTEEQAENPEGSVKNQEERLRQMVHFKNMDQNFGEIVDVYIDAGKSGKDTNRPELQRLLSAIRKNEVNLIMTTELSRISRSIKDFSEIWEMMQECGCGLLCLRENFDSSNAAGEMVMFMLANFAQFERRQISERVAANVKVRSGRGLYNGGPVPVGYKLIPDKKGYLAVDDDQAEVVRKCFEAFLRERSLSDTARWLNENGYRLRREMQGGGNFRAPQFSIDKLHKILKQAAYAGIKIYQDRGEEKEVKAVWEPIVDREIFDRVQEILAKNYGRNKPLRVKKYAYLLSGILRCKVCGERLCGKMATGHSNQFFYYEHAWRTKRNATYSEKILDCGAPQRYLATKLDEVVSEKISELLGNEELAKDLLAEAEKLYEGFSENKEAESLRAKITSLGGQLDAVAGRLAELPSNVPAKPIYDQMTKISESKGLLEKRLDELKRSGQLSKGKPIALKSYHHVLSAVKSLWESGAPEIKIKIIQWLVHRIEVDKENIDIHYQADESHLLRELADAGSRLFLCSEKDFKIFLFCGSHSLTNGWVTL